MRDGHIPGTPALAARLARRAAARLERAARVWRNAGLAAALPGSAEVVRACRDALAAAPPGIRARCLTGPDVRGFVNEAQSWTRAVALARRAGTTRSRTQLFDLVSRTEFLAVLVPDGRLDPRFPARVARFAVGRLRQAVADLAAFTLGLRLACPGGAPVRLRLAFREDAEQGRPAGRIDLGAIAGPAGPLGITRAAPGPRRPSGGAGRRSRRSVPAGAPGALRAVLRDRLLTLRGPRLGPLVLPSAGSPLRLPTDRPAQAGRQPSRGRPAGCLALVQRETIPGTSILLAPVVISRPFSLRVGQPLPGLVDRLARALRLVHLCWPEGHRTILHSTRMVVPVREPGTVSWSLAARPGISFINVFGKSLVDLADDLLHETAHHLLHDREEIEALLVPGPQTGEVQAFHSPWRRAQRPLRGLLHATFTFSFRAELLARLLAMAARQPALLRPFPGRRGLVRVRRELLRERRMLGASLRDLERASRAGLLTAGGRRLVLDLRDWHRRLSASRSLLRGGAAGRPRDRRSSPWRRPAR